MAMCLKLLLLYLPRVLLTQNSTVTSPLRSLVTDILRLSHSDLFVITDFTLPSQIAFVANAIEIDQHPMQVIYLTSSTLPDLGKNHALSPVHCENLPPESNYLHQKNAILTLIWISNNQLLPSVLSMLSSTVAKCPTEIHTGIYYRDNMLLFFIDDDNVGDEIEKAKGLDVIFTDHMLQKFRNAAVIFPDNSHSNDDLLIYNYNLYGNKTVLNMAYKASLGLPSLLTIFPAFPMNGHKLRIDALPYAYHVTADEVFKPPSPTEQFTNFSGYEIDMLKTLGQILNFTYEIRNPEDNLVEGKNWTGMTACVAEARCDLIISCVGISSTRLKVVLSSVAIDSDSLVFAAPNPQTYFNVLTMVHPFTYPVWLLILVALAMSTITIYLVSSKMFQWYGLNNGEWDTILKSFWFAFGMVVVQDVTKHVAEERPNQTFTLRIVILSWVVACAFITAVYSACLTSFLTTPFYGTPIETFDDVVKSRLPWDFVSYGAEVETFLAATNDSIFSVIWKDKILARYGSDTHSRLDNVLHRKMIATEWHNELESQAYIGFSTPDGRPLIHVSQHYITSRPSGWAFYPINPYFERFDPIILRMVEAGLVNEWKRRTMVDMKKRNNNKDVSKRVAMESDAEESDMITLSDMRGVFIGLAFGYGLAVTASLAELGYSAIFGQQ